MNRLAVALLALAAAPSAFAAKYNVDQSHSSANFVVRHLMVSKVHGRFKTLSGTIDFDEKAPEKTSIELTIDANSIDTDDAKRDGHLKSADFFDTAQFPTITFKSKKVTPNGEGKYSVVGDLTMHGTTKEVTLNAEGFEVGQATPWGTIRRGGTATGTVNRRDFGVNWQKTLDKGGVMVGDEVTLTVDIEAETKPEKAAAN
jgi:polyisoprenoid-binding protein YceI